VSCQAVGEHDRARGSDERFDRVLASPEWRHAEMDGQQAPDDNEMENQRMEAIEGRLIIGIDWHEISSRNR
jgi:hypothetical protein